jgi:hypothetical protein
VMEIIMLDSLWKGVSTKVREVGVSLVWGQQGEADSSVQVGDTVCWEEQVEQEECICPH